MGAGRFTLLDRGGCVADLRLREGVSWVSVGGSLWMGGLEVELVGCRGAWGLGTAMVTWGMSVESATSWRGSLPSCSSLWWSWRCRVAVPFGDTEIRGRLACVWR